MCIHTHTQVTQIDTHICPESLRQTHTETYTHTHTHSHSYSDTHRCGHTHPESLTDIQIDTDR